MKFSPPIAINKEKLSAIMAFASHIAAAGQECFKNLREENQMKKQT
jgi:hypothetical protein